MPNANINQKLLTVEKFLDAAQESDLAESLERMGLNRETLSMLNGALENARAQRLAYKAILAEQKTATQHKKDLKAGVQKGLNQLSGLIRRNYPKAPWLSMLGLETRYMTVGGEEGVRKAAPRSRGEAVFRAEGMQLLENINGLDASIREFLGSRGWPERRIDELKTRLAAFGAACETRDRAARQARAQGAVMVEACDDMERMYRDFSAQARLEADDNEIGMKLKSAASAIS